METIKPAVESMRERLLGSSSERVNVYRPPDEAVCPVCSDAGWLVAPGGGPGKRELVPCTRVDCEVRIENARRRLDQLFGNASIPPLFRDATLQDFAGEPAVLEIVERARIAGRGLYITGPVGVGKSHLAAAILRCRVLSGRTGLFTDTLTLLDAIRDTFHREATTREADLLRGVTEVDCLVLDDLGVEVDTAWARGKLYQIINSRYTWQRETICTTNVEPDVLKSEARLGERTISRLMAGCEAVALTGVDRRFAGR